MTSSADSGTCSCGDRSRLNINHRKRIPCWTYFGTRRCDISVYGQVVIETLPPNDGPRP